MDVKMYKIMGGERITASMPAASVERAMRKGWILEETAQRIEMPAEIIQIMKAKQDPAPEIMPEPTAKTVVDEVTVVTAEAYPSPDPIKTTPQRRRK